MKEVIELSLCGAVITGIILIIVVELSKLF